MKRWMSVCLGLLIAFLVTSAIPVSHSTTSTLPIVAASIDTMIDVPATAEQASKYGFYLSPAVISYIDSNAERSAGDSRDWVFSRNGGKYRSLSIGERASVHNHSAGSGGAGSKDEATPRDARPHLIRC